MDCKNSIDKLAAVVEDDEIEGNWNLDRLSWVDKEIENVGTKLLQCEIEHESMEMEIYDVNQLKDKGNYILKTVERKYSHLDNELKEIHCNYVKCVEKINSNNEAVDRKINFLTQQRDNLKKELEELKKTADENNQKLVQIKKMITIQEKKNMALTRKLKRLMENMHIAPDLKDRVNVILNGPRITNLKNPNSTSDK